LSERDEQLLRLRADRLAMAERQGDTAHRAITKHQRDDIHPHEAFFELGGQRARPDTIGVGRYIEIEIGGFASGAEAGVEPGLVTRNGDGEVGLADLAVLHVRDHAPGFIRVFQQDDAAARRVHLTRGLEQQTAHEALEVWRAGETLEVAANRRVGFRQLRDAFFSSALALLPNGIDQSLAMKRGPDDARGHLERRQLGGVNRAPLAGAIEPDDPDVLAIEEHRHDRLGLRANAFEHATTGLFARAFLDDADGATGAQLGALALEIALVVRA